MFVDNKLSEHYLSAINKSSVEFYAHNKFMLGRTLI